MFRLACSRAGRECGAVHEVDDRAVVRAAHQTRDRERVDQDGLVRVAEGDLAGRRVVAVVAAVDGASSVSCAADLRYMAEPGSPS